MSQTASTGKSSIVWPTTGLSFGGDYNPDQWPESVWDEDIELMKQAHVNIVSLGIFSWSRIEPRHGEFDWAWLDRLLEKLHNAGISVDLATPTAAPPPWLLHAEPAITPIDGLGRPRHPGTRLGWCPSNPVFRQHAVRIADEIASRYSSHPAVKMWHVSNELGGGNARCYCDISAQAFRHWLQERYGTVEKLNDVWGTAFWGHLYSSFSEILPPLDHETANNPSMQMDFQRFSSDELLGHFVAERDAIRAHSDAPVTTNLMVSSGGSVAAYETWAAEMDVIANDHYTLVDDAERAVELSLSGDRMRGLTGNKQPWLLMEHSVGAPSWQRVNRAKDPGEIFRNSISHVARGSDSAMFFQWRASLSGAEQFHSGMVPHAGADTRVFREITDLGKALESIGEVQGSLVETARVAILVDNESSWALEYGLKPHRALSYTTEVRKWYRYFWNHQIMVDVVHTGSDLEGYGLVVVPNLFVTGKEISQKLEDYVSSGGTVVVTYMSGIVDSNQRVIPGGYPGYLRNMLGVFTEEFRPLQAHESVSLSDGSVVDTWTEDTVLAQATPIITYADGASEGRAAVSRNSFGDGVAWYISASLPEETIETLLKQIVSESDIDRLVLAPAGVEATRRVQSTGETYLFLMNHLPARVEVPVTGTDLISGTQVTSSVQLEAGACAVIREVNYGRDSR